MALTGQPLDPLEPVISSPSSCLDLLHTNLLELYCLISLRNGKVQEERLAQPFIDYLMNISPLVSYTDPTYTPTKQIRSQDLASPSIELYHPHHLPFRAPQNTFTQSSTKKLSKTTTKPLHHKSQLNSASPLNCNRQAYLTCK
jgi:hypothetical protein